MCFQRVCMWSWHRCDARGNQDFTKWKISLEKACINLWTMKRCLHIIGLMQLIHIHIYKYTHIYVLREIFFFCSLLNLICNTCLINHAIKWSPILQKHSFLFSLWLMLRHFSYSHSLF